MFVVYIPKHRSAELRWIFDFVIGTDPLFTFQVSEKHPDLITIEHGEKSLKVANCLLSTSEVRWLKPASLPVANIPHWSSFELPESPGSTAIDLPVLYGKPEVSIADTGIECNIDLFGSIFFMLSRYEEMISEARDIHDRFPGKASLAAREGFLLRPIVDEYTALFWDLMERIWPQVQRPIERGEIRVSCDVDQPFDITVRNPIALSRAIGGDLIRDHSPSAAFKRINRFTHNCFRNYKLDPVHTFDWYMETCERFGRRASFYFISMRKPGGPDEWYRIGQPRILKLIKKLAERGHEIGLQGSYDSFNDCGRLKQELALLKSTCRSASIDAPVTGNRQHYLRWSTAETPDHLAEAGLAYDSTGGFADLAGFRYGTSRPFPMWSWTRSTPLRLLQRPLVLMECSVLADRYQGMGYTNEALDLMLLLKKRALDSGGDFTLLWHNSHLVTGADREFFRTLIQ